jgi:hypothetical protein
MKIVVIGGTGLIGSKLVAVLRQRGQEVLAASPDSGVNTLTGEGLAALAGAQVVVDVANSPSFEDTAVMKFFETSGRNLLRRSGSWRETSLGTLRRRRRPRARERLLARTRFRRTLCTGLQAPIDSGLSAELPVQGIGRAVEVFML